MTISDAPDDQRTGPQAPEKAAVLAAFRELDEDDRVLVWSAILAHLSWRPELAEGSPELEEVPP